MPASMLDSGVRLNFVWVVTVKYVERISFSSNTEAQFPLLQLSNKCLRTQNIGTLTQIYKKQQYLSFAWGMVAFLVSMARAEHDGTRAETRFRLSPKRTSPFKSAGASVQSTAGSEVWHQR